MQPRDPKGMMIDGLGLGSPSAPPNLPPMGNVRASGGRPPMEAAAASTLPGLGEPEGDESGDAGTFSCPSCGSQFSLTPMPAPEPSGTALDGGAGLASAPPPPPTGV